MQRLNGIRTMLRLDKEKVKDLQVATIRRKKNLQLLILGSIVAAALVSGGGILLYNHLKLQRIRLANKTSDSVIGENLKREFACPHCQSTTTLKEYRRTGELTAKCPVCGKSIMIRELIAAKPKTD